VWEIAQIISRKLEERFGQISFPKFGRGFQIFGLIPLEGTTSNGLQTLHLFSRRLITGKVNLTLGWAGFQFRKGGRPWGRGWLINSPFRVGRIILSGAEKGLNRGRFPGGIWPG